ncbi:MAG: flagellar hook-length control protein FliK [Comamonadaceae bacterium]|nr:flagellar hook-length control protein FliK [Comamonadaceae bacterium]
MSVESSGATQSHKAVAAAERKKAGKPDASEGALVTGFSMLLDMLAATEAPSDGITAADVFSGEAGPAFPVSFDFDKNVPLALTDNTRDTINVVANSTGLSSNATPSGTQIAEQAALATLAGAGLATPAKPWVAATGAPTTAPAADAKTADLAGLTPDGQSSFQAKKPVVASLASRTDADTDDVLAKAGESELYARAALPAPTDLPQPTKSAPRAQSLNMTQTDLKETRLPTVSLQTLAAPELAGAVALAGLVDGSLRAQERAGVKPGSGRFGGDLAGGFGASNQVNARADAPYQIEAASAAVPDTAVAETVSYWVTHGVQNAELKLDGLGSEPVEVSISLDGNQAQIDFRTNQPEVRLVLEAATAELRELLSGEGLQLAGVSVGSSGARNPQGDAQQQKPLPRQAPQSSSDPAVVLQQSRGLNTSLGQSLDLFV